MQEENWKAVTGYEGSYEVSDHGRVRSLDRLYHNGHGVFSLTGKLKTPATNAYGYARVQLWMAGKNQKFFVHTLVANAFLPQSVKPFVNHKDLNKLNNHVTNLEWVTHVENLDHARVAGRMAKRLTSATVRLIRDCHAKTGRTHLSIATEFGVARATVGRVLSHAIWK